MTLIIPWVLVGVVAPLITSGTSHHFLLDAEDLSEHIWNHRGEEGSQRLKRVSELRRKERAAPTEYEAFLSKNDQPDSKEYRYSPPPEIQPYAGGVEEDELDGPVNEEMLQWQLDSNLTPDERSYKSSPPLDAGFVTRKVGANDPVIRFLFGRSLDKRRKRHAADRRGQHRLRQRRQLLDMDVYPRNRRFRFLPWPRRGIFHKMARPLHHGYAG